MSDDALVRLARFVVDDPLDADPRTLAILRSGVIDTLGCIHAGARSDVAGRSRKAATAMEAAGAAKVIGTDLCASRPQAAFLNAVAGHALDFDDWEIPGNTHPTVVLLPALLAVIGKEVRGEDLARAYLAGFEVIARLGEALNFDHYDAGWHTTATLGAPGAAAACARVLGLSVEQTVNALSFAVSAASGFTCQFGSNAKPLQAGFAARSGVEAAFLASAGLTGQPDVLDHSRGAAALMGGLNTSRLSAALAKLGGTYALAEHGLVMKPWPSCGYTHRIMTCALRMRDRVGSGRIERIELHLPDFHAAVLPFGSPCDRSEALFSLPFVAAIGLSKAGLDLTDLETRAWEQPDIKKLMAVTEVHPFKPVKPEVNYSEEDPDRMIVVGSNGQRLEETCSFPTGSPQFPMDERQILSKFESNTGPVSEAQACKRLWTRKLRNWLQEDNVHSLFFEQGSMQ
ncbi:MmgE/PrpD family protein [Roseibium sp. MMSF_3544]|uniref:MmgE/PrpD family protein n=1 Tax=unclassified Roseibium TaxID=2629323 RepID=UPI0027402CD9|nr:MmgE/PrpD family protein [Roseibium sp. MMSF_3544]